MKKIWILTSVLIALFCLAGCDDDKVTPDLKPLYPLNDVYYEVFIRSFADADGDGIGDLRGMVENFDYFVDLGVTGIWMMPFNATTSYHGYSVTDFYTINPEYGTMDDWDDLVMVANENNIKLMMDFVINHTSDQHEWFIKSRANDSVYRDYYTWKQGIAYAAFPGGMVDLKLSNPAVRAEIYDIGEFWLDKGITGFRLDAAKHFYDLNEVGKSAAACTAENWSFISEFRRRMRDINPDVYVVSEVFSWAAIDYAEYFLGSDSAFNFEISKAIMDAANRSLTGYTFMVNGIYETISSRLTNPITNVASPFVDAPFLRNHDLNRTGSELGNNVAKMKFAAEMLLTLPGSPFIYYGEEIGMQGTRKEGLNVPGYGTAYDEWRRMPFKWGSNEYQTNWFPGIEEDASTVSYADQKDDPDSLFTTYKKLIALRKATPALMFGNDFIPFEMNEIKHLQMFYRTIKHGNYEQAVLVIHNISSTEQLIPVSFKKMLYSSQDDLKINSVSAYGTVVLEVPYSKAITV